MIIPVSQHQLKVDHDFEMWRAPYIFLMDPFIKEKNNMLLASIKVFGHIFIFTLFDYFHAFLMFSSLKNCYVLEYCKCGNLWRFSELKCAQVSVC